MKNIILLSLWLLSSSAFAGQIGVIIGTDSGQMRRVVVPDSDAQLHKQNWAGPGETLLLVDQAADITAEIQKFTGKPVTMPLAAVVDGKTGFVTSVIVADPALDQSTAGQLVAAFPGVMAGQTFDFARKVFVAPAHVETQQTTDVDGNVLSSKVVLVPAADVVAAPLDLQPSIKLVPLTK